MTSNQKSSLNEESEELAEEDAPADDRQKLQETAVFHVNDTTLNFIESTCGGMLTTLSEGGLSHLLAGARGSVGIKSGRYMFEVRIVECVSQFDTAGSAARTVPKSYLRVGMSPSGSMPVLGDHMDCAYFDTEGLAVLRTAALKRQKPGGQRFVSGDILTVVFSVGAGGGKLSLYRNGVLSSFLRDLPEELTTKPLFPTISFKGMVLHVNFGPIPSIALPFKCRMLQDAALEDVVIAIAKSSEDEKGTAVFPVCLPDEGSFDWIDMFLEGNPHFTEISDRKIHEWASKSGFMRPGQSRKSNDKPGMIDDGSAKKVLMAAAIAQKRNVVIMELKANFIQTERELALQQLPLPDYKKIAKVVIGEPPTSFKDAINRINLSIKQDKMDHEHKKLLEERQQKNLALKLQKEASLKRKNAEKMATEKRRKLEEDADEKEGQVVAKEVKQASAKEEDETQKMDDAKHEFQVKDENHEAKDEVKDEVKEEEIDESKSEKQDEDEPMEPLPIAELTPEEKKLFIRIGALPDIDSTTLAESYLDFTLPGAEEGFDEIQCEWLGIAEAEQYLEAWKRKFKSSVRVEGLQPSDWFRAKRMSWENDLNQWKRKAADFAKAQLLEKKKATMSANSECLLGDIKLCGGKTIDVMVDAAFKRGSLNPFKVENICDIGENSEPLFANFALEDWMLAALRFEVWLLVTSYEKDVNDPERRGVPLEHFLFYFIRYFKRALQPQLFGMENVEELLGLIKDSVVVDPETKCAYCPMFKVIPSSNDIFIKLTEASRIDREMRKASGDVSAALKFSAKTPQVPQQTSVESGGGLPLARKLQELIRPVTALGPQKINIVGSSSVRPVGPQQSNIGIKPLTAAGVQPLAAGSSPALNLLKAKLAAAGSQNQFGGNAASMQSMLPQLAAMLKVSPARPAATPWAVMAQNIAQLAQAKAAAKAAGSGMEPKASASTRS